MADERYEWLDKEAAEHLLRGEPVEPADDRARSDALRLTAALEAARNLPSAVGELPGENTALAAFRQAAHARQRSGAGARRAMPKGLETKAGQQPVAWQDRLPSVLIGGGRRPVARRPRWSRPVRYGLVLSLAGCAIGGVAVASGAGIFPGPFGGQESPLPAASVSSAASPEELASGLPSDRGSSRTPPGKDPTPGTPGPSEDSSTGSGHSSRDSVGGPTEGPGAGDSDPEGSGSTSHRPGGADGNHASQGPGIGSGEVYEKAVQACREYRAGTLDRAAKRRLVEMAKSEKNLDRFCARLDGEDDRNGGSGQGAPDSGAPDSGAPNAGAPDPGVPDPGVPDAAPGSDDGSGSGGSSSGGGQQGEDGSGSLPSVSFRTAEPSPDASPDVSAGVSAGTGAGTWSAPAASATTAPSAR
ncbi:hypothetical protein [Streptomyces finlayi]|uniref:hypothetical protein n=1 Tax=Streptomyces finlayi TaxID=67296 RepID=UPI001629B36B|nr:hypothetical protein [Streptomyces finlayi]